MSNRALRSIGPRDLGTLCATLFLLAACSTQPRQSAEPVTLSIRHHFDGPSTEQLFRLSPDGQKLASLEKQGRAINLVVTDLGEGRRHQATDFRSGAIAAFTWISNERLLFYSVDVRDLVAVQYDGSLQRRLNPEANLVQVLHPLPHEDDAILAAHYQPQTGATELVRLDVFSGRMELVAHGPHAWPKRWFLEPEGFPRAAELSDDEEKLVLVLDRESGAWEEALRQPRWDPEIRLIDGLSHEDQVLAVVIDRSGETTLRTFGLNDGLTGPPLSIVDRRGCCQVTQDGSNGRLLVAWEKQPSVSAHFFDDDLEADMADISAGLNGRDVIITQTSEDMRFLLLTATSVLRDPDFYLADRINNDLRLLAKSPEVLPLLTEYRAALDHLITLAGNQAPSFDMRSTEWTRLSNRQVDSTAQRSVVTGTRPQK